MGKAKKVEAELAEAEAAVWSEALAYTEQRFLEHPDSREMEQYRRARARRDEVHARFVRVNKAKAEVARFRAFDSGSAW